MYSLREQIILLWSTPFYITVIAIEILLTNIRLHKKTYTLRDTFNNVVLTLCNAAVDAAFKLTYLWILIQVFKVSPFQHWTNMAAYWICLLIAEDFAYYWLHRFDHEIRFFWAVHVTHHSSEHFNFSTGFRSSVFEPLYRFVYFIPLAWFGFKPLDILFMYSATQIWGTLVHTETVGKLGWLEYIFVTPSHHRVHHGSNPKYLDKNMGMFLIVWDRIFGTFQEELSEKEYAPIHYGLTKNMENPNLFQLIFHEWIQIYKDATAKGLTLKERMNYIFGAPGYSHDGSRKTSVQMLAEENERRGEIDTEEALAVETIPL
ncbi:sterol desaturase [Arachidicoccus ginsenosidimutans]|uniref:sterol desaturase family protein n=1 Tax=Arachidicoccus sp. BS20 TaxID=1850526 RepID=UPI0007F11D12|nr:sterol desaturase family protein [Arachidicoccus sp. BS20]ANI90665.1 sterol desaturase [Arachidicoccus sp. BS20]